MEREGPSPGQPTPGPADGGAGLSVPLAYVPRRHPEVLELDLEDGLILYNRDNSLVHHLNPSARIVWYLCDGTADVGRIASEIAEEYGLEPGPIRTQVAALVAELDAVGVIEEATA